MNIVLLLIQIIIWALAIFIFIPIFMFFAYLFFDQYNKLYVMLVGQGNKWYQNLFLFPASLLSLRKKRYIQKNIQNGSTKKHIAVVLANNYFPENIMAFSSDVVVKLIKHLKKKNKNYQIYDKITSEKLKEIIMNKNVKSIFLFGHGQRHGIKVGRNETVYYCEFPNHPKKELIAQFHCNHANGKSLADYGKKPIYSFITDDVQNQIKINKQLKEIIKRRLV